MSRLTNKTRNCYLEVLSVKTKYHINAVCLHPYFNIKNNNAVLTVLRETL